MFKLNTILAFFSLVLCSLASAQEEPLVTTRFSVVGFRSTPQDLYYLPGPKEEPVKLEFLRLYRSETYDYQGPATITFFRLIPHPEGEGTLRQPVCRARFLPDQGSWLVFFTEVENKSWRALALPDDSATLPPDHFVVYNGTGVQLSAKIGEKALLLDPGLSESVSTVAFQRQNVEVSYSEMVNGVEVTKTQNTVNRTMPILVVYRNQETLQKLHEERLLVNPGARYIWFFLPPQVKGSKRFQTKLLEEIPASREEK